MANEKIQDVHHRVERDISKYHENLRIKITTEFKDFSSKHDVSLELYEKKKGLLDKHMIFFEQEWINYSRSIVSLFFDIKSKLFGNARLNQILSDLLNKK